MKIVIACDSFKGSLDAFSVSDSVKQGIKQVWPETDVVLCPMADGGEGTARILTNALNGSLVTSMVHGPLMDLVKAQWGLIDNKTAVIEAAEAAGLILVDPKLRNPLKATSYGLGELIKCALDREVDNIIIGLGGSATNDGGTGMAEALGVDFLDDAFPRNGGNLGDIVSIDMSGLDTRIGDVSIQIALDVTNPLLGSRGASHVFAPQKGANRVQVELLEQGMEHLALLCPHTPPDFPGAGAAGGLGWGMAAFLNAEMKTGIDLCLDILRFESLAENADLIITGEGFCDEQTLQGKVSVGVARRAKAMGIPTIVLAGDHNIPLADLGSCGIIGCYSICKDLGVSVERSINDTSNLLKELAAKIINQF